MLLERPWTATFLTVENGIIFISGGASPRRGKTGMEFEIMTKRQPRAVHNHGVVYHGFQAPKSCWKSK